MSVLIVETLAERPHPDVISWCFVRTGTGRGLYQSYAGAWDGPLTPRPPSAVLAGGFASDASTFAGDAAILSLLLPLEYFVSPSGSDSNPGTLVAPFLTLAKARDVVRAAQPPHGAFITLRGGRYQLSEPLALTTADGAVDADATVKWRAYAGETPVISGGTAVTGWTDIGGGTWAAPLSGRRFRQFYTNDLRAIRCRKPDSGWYSGATYNGVAKQVTAAELAGFDITSGKVELVAQKEWDQGRFRITGRTATTIDLAAPEKNVQYVVPPFRFAGSSTAIGPFDFHIENAIEFLDAPGEWFIDEANDRVLYRPRLGETIGDLTAYAPAIERLVTVTGTLGAPVLNLQFEGITFEHTTWLRPDTEGINGVQSGWLAYGTNETWPYVIEASFATGLSLFRCVVRHSGGGGVRLTEGVKDSTIEGNTVTSISGNGIALARQVPNTLVNASLGDLPTNYSAAYRYEAYPDDARTTVENIRVWNNRVSYCGADYWGGVGIIWCFARAIDCQHNEIAHMPYTGLTCGWGWTAHDTVNAGHTVRRNHVWDIMFRCFDGGGIYTLSKQLGTVIEENYVHDLGYLPGQVTPAIGARNVSGTQLFPLYLDNCSEGITARNNVLIGRVLIYQATGTLLAKNNTLTNNTSSGQPSVVTNAGPQAGF